MYERKPIVMKRAALDRPFSAALALYVSGTSGASRP